MRVRRSAAAISSLWQAYAMPVAMMRFDFPAGLPCTPDVLGLRSWVHLPPHKAELCMPIETKREVGFAGAFAPPRLRGIKWFTKVNDHFSHDEWFGWGSFHQGGPNADSWLGHIDSAILRVNAPDVSDEGLQDIGLTVNRSIYAWYLLLRDWLESLTHVDLGPEHAEGLTSGRSPVETPWWVGSTRVRGERGYSLVNPPVTIQLRGSPHVHRGAWQRAVRETNASRRPPEAHLLLRDARAAANRRLVRRCVLDAATAAEVVLTPLLAALLDKALGRSTRGTLVPDTTNISRKIPALVALGISLPAHLQRDLFNLRNKVIHEGRNPTIGEARKALDAAAEVVRVHTPI
jgi:hypothetical protein